MTIAHLPQRGVIELEGPDRVTFLQGLVSNDVAKATPDRCVWAALLTAQGRYRAEFFIFATQTSLLLDAPRSAIPDLLTRLGRLKLRSKVTLTDRCEQFAVHAAWNERLTGQTAISAPDPRLPTAGIRILAPAILPGAAGAASYLTHRLALGLTDHDDLEPDKSLLMEANFAELHGIDWDKGCYMGQELTARTRYRGLIKRRLIPIDAASDLPETGTITAGDHEVGALRTAQGTRGLALLRLDTLDQPLQIGTQSITPDIPAWLTLAPQNAQEKAPA